MADQSHIATLVVDHFRKIQRDLPWRRTTDAYAIWVSEIMLQQTRVQTVIPYYERWLASFPTVNALADAELDDVLAHWAGLGYYSRARNLHKGAADVVARYDGRVPDTVKELRTIAGIGRYTAGAIASIAHGTRAPLVDGNVARVFARVFEIEDDIKSTAAAKRLWQLADELVPAEAPGDFNQGLMELGATICTPTKPSCLLCPLRSDCKAYASGRQHDLPVMPKRKRKHELPQLDMCAAWVERKRKVLLWRRRADGLYGGLWELPQQDEITKLLARFDDRLTLNTEQPVASHEQVLSHRRLRIRVWPAALTGRVPSAPEDTHDRAQWHALAELGNQGISSATRAIIDRYQESEQWKPTKKP